jgi:multisubunit Na+/H+ antiporter MnhC subunit
VSQHTVIHARSTRSREGRLRPAYYLPLALFLTSIVGGLAVLAGELPGPIF